MRVRQIAFSFGVRYDVRSEEYLSLVWSNDCLSRRIYAALVRWYISLCNWWSNSESACFKRSSTSIRTGGALRVGVCTDLQGGKRLECRFFCSDIIKSQEMFAWVLFRAIGEGTKDVMQ